MSDQSYADGHWQSADGLTLHFRDYPGRADRPPILCIPGLTRNARDFEPLAEAFAGEWRVICVELRGRGESDYAKDAASYDAPTYLADIEALLAELGIDRFVAVGTSLGGVLTMLLAARGAPVAAALLNDIGPTIEDAGLDRIRELVGQGRSYPTWIHAARALRESSADVYPDYALPDWLRFAKRVMAVGQNERIVSDYDMKIAETFQQARGGRSEPLWGAFQALTGRPVCVLRGELSDLLSAATLDEMQRALPGLDAVTVPRTGHVPTFEEPESRAALARLLEHIA
ncbi:MAG TPA: alpha/beta hydrolase [Croceibacterium sp.]|nr:alpha/beta hydrolase [Croceibacterium sp.]